MENNLPQGWGEIELSEITNYKKGKKPKKMQSTFFENALVYLDIKAIEKGNNEIFVDRESSNITDENDLIIVWDGARAGWVAKSRKGAIGSTILALTPKIDKDFLFRFLQTQFNYLQSNHRGTGIPHVDPDIFWNIKVPIAPLAEQHRIVAKLDAVMQKVESSKQRLENVTQLEHKIFLKNIYDGSEFYKTVKLGDYCEEQTKAIGQEWANYRLIGVSKDNGVVDLRTGGKKTFEKYKIVQPGWFLYNPMRVDIGSIAIWNGNVIALTSPDYVVFSIKKYLSPSILLKFLKSKYGLSEINNNTQGAVRSRLYFQNLANIQFPFSGEKNHKNAELLFKGFNKLSRRKKIIENLIIKLMQSILAKAFRGELVPQNPNDEPASVLLEKIKAEKEKLAAEKQGNKPKVHSIEDKPLKIASERKVKYK